MKKYILALFFLAGLLNIANAQFLDDELEDSGVSGKVRAQRVAFITERIGLTPEESQKFWPIHNLMEEELRKARAKYQVGQPLENLNDAEAEKVIRDRFAMEEELLNIKKNYYQKFKTVVSPRKIVLFVKADREFKRMLLKQVQSRMRGG